MCKLKTEEVLSFLKKVDKSFNVPLSQKQDLSVLAKKLCERGTVCAIKGNNGIVSLVAGYTENLTDNIAYISVVATLDTSRGKGLALSALKEFISICKTKNIDAVHLYTSKDNEAAISMYKKAGFYEWVKKDEPRPYDKHLILTLRR